MNKHINYEKHTAYSIQSIKFCMLVCFLLFIYIMKKVFKTRRKITVKDKLNVLFSTYQSLTNFRAKRIGSTTVSK